jgi:glycosyltransferase involved in cell wall biosynthesis
MARASFESLGNMKTSPLVSVLCFTGNSGLTDYSVSLCRELSKRVRTRLITAKTLDPRFRMMGFEAVPLFRRSRYYPFDLIRLCLKLMREPKHVVLMQGPLKFPLVDGIFARALRAWGFHTALTIHDVMPHYPRVWSPIVQRFFFRSFDSLVVHSTRARDDLRSLGVGTDPLVVPHGIYDLFRLGLVSRWEARESVLGEHRGRIALLFFGHVEPRKGFFEFLSLAERLDATERFVFIVAGPCDLAKFGRDEEARMRIARLKCMVVRFGRIPHEDVERYFEASDIVMLPYLEGTTSGVLKLALAFGKPVVASDVGDIRESVPSGAGAMVHPGPGMVDELVNATETVAGDLASYTVRMEAGLSGLDWSSIGERYLTHIHELTP